MTIEIMSEVSTFNRQFPLYHEALLREKREELFSTKVGANTKLFTHSLIVYVL